MLRSPLPRPLRLRLAAPLAGLAVLMAGAAPVTPAQAQSIGTVTKPGLPDPWHGVILITPLDEDSPYEAAQRAAEAGEAEGATPAPAEASVATDAPLEPLEPFDPEKATATMPSLWETIELGLGGAPEEPEPEPPKPYQQLQPRTAPVERARATLPTRMELRQGAAMVSISSSASATAPASGALSTTATSGSGEIKGRVGLEQDHLTVYSAGAVGASASPGSATVYDSMAVGSTYSVPLAPLGLGPEKLGASVEVDKSQSVTTGIELRAPVGSAERFISVQRSQSPGSEASGIIKAGVLGKF